MERRRFVQSAVSGVAGVETARFKIPQESQLHFSYWAVAIQLADALQSLSTSDSDGESLVDRVAEALVESARAALADLLPEAEEAFGLALQFGSDLWGEVEQIASDAGILEFGPYLDGTLGWLGDALAAWREDGTLPTLDVSRSEISCFFGTLPEQTGCIRAPAVVIGRCAATGLLGLAAGGPGFLAVFGACLRRQAPGVAIDVALRCLRPAAESCFGEQ